MDQGHVVFVIAKITDSGNRQVLVGMTRLHGTDA